MRYNVTEIDFINECKYDDNNLECILGIHKKVRVVEAQSESVREFLTKFVNFRCRICGEDLK